ncbi:hypothetical protein JCM19037_3042 [Geomicrobium sp. JCM 19037]|uniref:hypothetical protein n=1 Tax=Geomicrobium sp. JCM 19037 TaxID=1460634 RepID=UPI00045F2B35|nr:hypothetical protein [Geomicrobium sp. JCM 19037]GAK04610.1 hypothetical protein JCM19037_3042 [Geomicrobium sp. JCM 19037]
MTIKTISKDRVMSVLIGVASIMFLPLGIILGIVGLIYFKTDDPAVRLGRALCWLSIILFAVGLLFTTYYLLIS